MPHNSQAGKNAPNRSKEGAPPAEHPPREYDIRKMRLLAERNDVAFVCICLRPSPCPSRFPMQKRLTEPSGCPALLSLKLLSVASANSSVRWGCHVSIRVCRGAKRLGDREGHGAHSKGQRQHVTGVVRSGDVQEEDRMNADRRDTLRATGN